MPLSNVDARLAQLVERKTLNLVVVGSSPTVGIAYTSPNQMVILDALGEEHLT